MKRFWREVSVVPDGEGHGIRLDGRPVRTPGKRLLVLPGRPLAQAVAAEWQAVGEELDPRAMPLTGIANAATDLVGPDPAGFAARLAAYAESDLLCYRAEYPPSLAERQRMFWEPPLTAMEQRFDIGLHRAQGVMHLPQPPESLARIAAAFRGLSPFQLAALDPVVTITGSALLGLAVAEGLVEPDDAFLASILDELWQEEQWGIDEEALETRKGRRALFDAAARFLRLADQA